MTRTTRTAITLFSTLLLALGCVELESAEDGSAGSPGFGGTDLRVVASAPAPDDDAVPFDHPFFVIRTSRPVVGGDAEVSLMSPTEKVPLSVELLTDDDPYIVRITPSAPLRPGTPYELQLPGGPEGWRGDDGATMRDDVMIRFRTRVR